MKHNKKTTSKYSFPKLYINRLFALIGFFFLFSCSTQKDKNDKIRERIPINDDWKFYKYESINDADNLIYDERPQIGEFRDSQDADTKPNEAVDMEEVQGVLKSYILPTANHFIKDPANKHVRPEGNPGSNFPFVQNDFDDSSWEKIDLPHDWAIKGPFQEGNRAEVGGGMGRLPVNGVAWYRKKINLAESDEGKSIFLDIDGAMSYAIVWLNGNLIGGWPYGYASWRLDLTPYIVPGGENQLAIRIDNPNNSSRWYPGAGIYRNVWLVKTNPVHIGQWGTYITTPEISENLAVANIEVTVDNDSKDTASYSINAKIYELDENGEKSGDVVEEVYVAKKRISPGESIKTNFRANIKNPKLWGPPPTQKPNRYIAEISLREGEKVIDNYGSVFGIRTVEFDGNVGVVVNGKHIKIQGVNQHHDLGALGGAFNYRAAERQLEMLKELGCNAIRMAHNPPAPELLELTDKMGFLVIDEIFDVWERRKTPHDFHLIFPDWYEADTHSFIHRDRNHPSVVLWSYGNEVGEQYTGAEGAAVGQKLVDIFKEEDPTRLTTASMNYAKPDMEFPTVMDVISLNYQGEGIRNAPAYAHLQGIKTPPLYPAFHEKFPDKVILSSETASTLSTRGTYIFPVTEGNGAPASDETGGDPENQYVSAYEFYTAPFGASPDKVFATQDQHPYVGGEFVWTGWDYIGEPTPYYQSRSSYFGIIDLAGFKKDRFYLYQSRWRPDFPMAHILPHWNWPDRVGKITPVHVFTSGDEAELFLNGESLGRKKKGEYEYRIRWDDVKYEPGELKVIAYKNGKGWAEDVIKTTEMPAGLEVTADRKTISDDGKDLSFITVKVVDENGLFVANADNLIEFEIDGPGKIIATDNGDPTDMVAFSSLKRKAFSGLALAIVQSDKNKKGTITIKAKSEGLKEVNATIKAQ